MFPLHTKVCDACFLVQADHEVPADAIFDDGYAYFSSFSPGWVEHARRYADAMIERFGLGPESLVVEIASNDGYLLKHFLARDVPVLGIEPTANTAEAARAIGVRTDVVFFNAADRPGARRPGRHGRPDGRQQRPGPRAGPQRIRRRLPHVLKPEGVLTFEFPHLLNLIEKVQFDTIYHEHYSYLSLLAVEQVLGAHRLRVFDVELLPTHGGSLRLFCCHQASGHEETEALRSLRDAEAAAGLNRAETYDGFTARVEAVRDSFQAFLRAARDDGKAIAAYGAAAKGNTFLNYCGTTSDDIVEAYDANPAKQDRYLPGSHIPVRAPDAVRLSRPDYVLILPWNLKDEITRQLSFIADWGGRFVIASPAHARSSTDALYGHRHRRRGDRGGRAACGRARRLRPDPLPLRVRRRRHSVRARPDQHLAPTRRSARCGACTSRRRRGPRPSWCAPSAAGCSTWPSTCGPTAPRTAAGSATELSADSLRGLFIPEGVAHGFITLEPDTDVLYQIAPAYTPGHAAGVRWDDPAFGIVWPLAPALMSAADAAYPDYDA